MSNCPYCDKNLNLSTLFSLFRYNFARCNSCNSSLDADEKRKKNVAMLLTFPNFIIVLLTSSLLETYIMKIFVAFLVIFFVSTAIFVLTSKPRPLTDDKDLSDN